MTREEQIAAAFDDYSDARKLCTFDDFEYAYLQVAFEEGAEWADKNPNPQNIAEYLYKEKGYPISLNGEIPTYEEVMNAVKIKRKK